MPPASAIDVSNNALFLSIIFILCITLSVIMTGYKVTKKRDHFIFLKRKAVAFS